MASLQSCVENPANRLGEGRKSWRASSDLDPVTWAPSRANPAVTMTTAADASGLIATHRQPAFNPRRPAPTRPDPPRPSDPPTGRPSDRLHPPGSLDRHGPTRRYRHTIRGARVNPRAIYPQSMNHDAHPPPPSPPASGARSSLAYFLHFPARTPEST